MKSEAVGNSLGESCITVSRQAGSWGKVRSADDFISLC